MSAGKSVDLNEVLQDFQNQINHNAGAAQAMEHTIVVIIGMLKEMPNVDMASFANTLETITTDHPKSVDRALPPKEVIEGYKGIINTFVALARPK